MKAKSLSPVRLFATPWTAAHQAPPSMRFSRQEYWGGMPLPSPSFSKALDVASDSKLCSLHSFYSSQRLFYYHGSTLLHHKCYFFSLITTLFPIVYIHYLNSHTLCYICLLLSLKVNVMKKLSSLIIYVCSHHYHSLIHSKCLSFLRFQIPEYSFVKFNNLLHILLNMSGLLTAFMYVKIGLKVL